MTKAPPRHKTQRGHERQQQRRAFDKIREATQPFRQWYKTARWQRVRWSVLARDLFTCQICGKLEPVTSQLVADHKVPHRGEEHLFWDATNLACVCKPCHDSEKQRLERGGRPAQRLDADGWPL